MEIKNITLKNYRNYETQNLTLSPGLNVLMGKNAQGKTNLLESVFLCAIGKSPRTTKDKDLILWEQNFAKVSIELNKKSGNKKIEVYLFSNQNKAIKINGLPIKKMGELMGEFNAIYFSPDELKLVKNAPDERRRFMDIDLCQFDKNYFYALNKYNKILLQRNKLLKTSSHINSLKDTILIWNEQLATVGAFIIMKRLALIEQLKVYASQAQKYLTDNNEVLEISYVGIHDNQIENIKNELLKNYESTLEKDFNLGYTSFGPHRDDIKLSVNGIDVRAFGSQGQQRTCALSLKLAELEVFKENIGEYPVLLLDDVLSELDLPRKEKLLNKVKNFQTIITCTDFNYNLPAKKFLVDKGKIENNL